MKRRTKSFLKKEEKRLKRKAQKENLGKRFLDRLQKTEVIRSFGKLAGIYKSKRGTEYLGWHVPAAGSFPGTFSMKDYRIVPIHTFRLPVLRQCTIDAAEAAEKNELKPEELEVLLDLIFAELNKRLNKEPKVKDAA